MVTSISRHIAHFVCGLDYNTLPRQIVDKIKVLLLHGIGVGLAAYDTETAQIAIEVAKKQGQGKATILLDGNKVTANAASFANATILHSRAEEDEYHEGLMHPGVVLIPAALAIGEAVGANGKDLIVALAAGYEVSCRLSKDFYRLSVPRGFRSTPTYGVFGATATAAKLLNLSEERAVYSLGWSANLASGMLQCAISKTPEMPIQAGLASQNGVLAAQLGEAGALSAEDMLEGERGFYYAICGTNEGMEKIVEGLGSDYKMTDVFQKRHPVGGSMQTPVSAMLDMVCEYDIVPRDIERIELRLSPRFVVYPGINSLKPGLISAQYCLAVACVHRKMTLRAVADMNNPTIRDTMTKIVVKGDETILPPACKLSIILKDKQVLTKDMAATYRDYSFGFNEEQEYVLESLAPEMAVSKANVKRVIDLIADLENWKSVSRFMQAVAQPTRKGERIRLPF